MGVPRVHVLSSAVSLAWSVSCPQWAVWVAHTTGLPSFLSLCDRLACVGSARIAHGCFPLCEDTSYEPISFSLSLFHHFAIRSSLVEIDETHAQCLNCVASAKGVSTQRLLSKSGLEGTLPQCLCGKAR